MNFLRLISVFISCVMGFSGTVAQDLLGIEGEEATMIGMYIQDLGSGEVLYDYNSEIAMTPASVMKAVTTATALSLLSEDFQIFHFRDPARDFGVGQELARRPCDCLVGRPYGRKRAFQGLSRIL